MAYLVKKNNEYKLMNHMLIKMIATHVERNYDLT